ncbi:hypothetical protein GCM10020001_080620 [Nonomuraea salmonea]
MALEPLRRDEPGRADHQALLGERGLALLPGDAEVGQHHPAALGQEHVARLDVAVLQALGVGDHQRLEHVGAHPGRVVGGHGAEVAYGVAQRAAPQQLHDQPRPVLLDHHVVQGHDAGVAQPRGGLRLAHRPRHRFGALFVRHALGQRELLDRDIALKHLVPGQPHLPHATGAQRAQQGVAAGKSSRGHKGKGN